MVAAWWLAPLTLSFFWLRFLPRHDLVGTSFQVIVIVVAVGVGVATYRISKAALRGDQWPGPNGVPTSYRPDRWTVLALVLLVPLSYWAINGDPLGPRRAQSSPSNGPGLVSHLENFGDWVDDQRFLDLIEAEVSEKPANWDQVGYSRISRNVIGVAVIELVNEAELEEIDLRYMTARKAFLVGVGLKAAKLTKSDLSYADLRGAILTRAHLESSQLLGAKLDRAVLAGAHLREATLTCTYLRNAILSGTDLRDANLMWAKLDGAELSGADLDGAWLHGADLSEAKFLNEEQLSHACGDTRTILPDGLESSLPHCSATDEGVPYVASLPKQCESE
jgi:uncharacterized protein YjbI with pentapeptide repeats